MTWLPIEVYGLNIHKHFLPLVVTLGFLQSTLEALISRFKAGLKKPIGDITVNTPIFYTGYKNLDIARCSYLLKRVYVVNFGQSNFQKGASSKVCAASQPQIDPLTQCQTAKTCSTNCRRHTVYINCFDCPPSFFTSCRGHEVF